MRAMMDDIVPEELVLSKPSRELIQRARELRGSGTEAEGVVWELVRGRRLVGLKFRRQHPMGHFVADFYCESARLIVDIDGAVHAEPDQAERDRAREGILRANKLRVLRFSNEDVLNDADGVMAAIRRMAMSG